jgi:hypothetical protein
MITGGSETGYTTTDDPEAYINESSIVDMTLDGNPLSVCGRGGMVREKQIDIKISFCE